MNIGRRLFTLTSFRTFGHGDAETRDIEAAGTIFQLRAIMSFLINDRLGIALELNETGLMQWDLESKDFSVPMEPEEIRNVKPIVGARACSEDEARAYMKAKDNAQQPPTP